MKTKAHEPKVKHGGFEKLIVNKLHKLALYLLLIHNLTIIDANKNLGEVDMRKTCGIVGLIAVLAGGCAQIPAPMLIQGPAPTAVGQACIGCVTDPRPAYAVSAPGPCNDFPVTYRVQVPAERDKVLPVDQVVVRSSIGNVVAQANTSCYAPR